MIDHLSPSAIRLFLCNQHAFYKKYVLGEYDTTTNPSALEGVTFHKVLEEGYTDMPDEEALIAIMKNLVGEKTVLWGKTGSFEKSVKHVQNALGFFYSECVLPSECEREVRITAPICDHEGKALPLPMKGIIDRIHTDEQGRTILIDYKLTTSPTIAGEYNLAYVLQALPYFLLMESQGKTVAYMEFLQVKKTKNKDGSPQVVSYLVTPDDIREHRKSYCIFVRAVCETIAGRIPTIQGSRLFLPNPFDEYSGESSWQEFTLFCNSL